MFYTFRQNNSGGSFDFDREAGISKIVIVEAPSINVANARALDIGLYFDGCSYGRDCSCCGDRWSEIWDNEKGDPVPSYYGEPLSEFRAKQSWDEQGWMYPAPEAFVHMLDGRVLPYLHTEGRFLLETVVEVIKTPLELEAGQN